MWSSCFFYRDEFCGVILPVRLMLPIFFNIDEFCGVVLRVAMILLNFVYNDDFSGVDFSGVDKPKNDTDQYGLRYAEFVVPLVKAVQEQQAIIDSQNKKIDALLMRIEALEAAKK